MCWTHRCRWARRGGYQRTYVLFCIPGAGDCSALSRSFVTLVGDDVDRSPFNMVTATFALVVNEMKPGSGSALVIPKTRKRTRGEKERVLRKRRTKRWESYKEKRMEFLLERASEDLRRNPHRWSVPFPHPKPIWRPWRGGRCSCPPQQILCNSVVF